MVLWFEGSTAVVPRASSLLGMTLPTEPHPYVLMLLSAVSSNAEGFEEKIKIFLSVSFPKLYFSVETIVHSWVTLSLDTVPWAHFGHFEALYIYTALSMTSP